MTSTYQPESYYQQLTFDNQTVSYVSSPQQNNNTAKLLGYSSLGSFAIGAGLYVINNREGNCNDGRCFDGLDIFSSGLAVGVAPILGIAALIIKSNQPSRHRNQIKKPEPRYIDFGYQTPNNVKIISASSGLGLGVLLEF